MIFYKPFIGVFLILLLTSSASALTTISTCAELQAMNGDLAEDYILISDIDCDVPPYNSGTGFVPIGCAAGCGARPVAPFTGNFDGDSYIIHNLYINRPGEYCIGLFGYSQGSIIDVGLVDVEVYGDWEVGGLVGYHGYRGVGDITNSYVTGYVEAFGWGCGGLIGYNEGTVIGSYTDVEVVSSDDDVGGLIGFNFGNVTYCYALGNVTGTADVAGLIGYAASMFWDPYNNPLTHCYATGNIQGTGGCIGGLVGYSEEGDISESFATGDVYGGGSDIGGLVGYSEGNITNCYARGDVTNPIDRESGGLVGNVEATISNSYATGDVIGGWAGGLAGYAGGYSPLSISAQHSYSTGAASGNAWGGTQRIGGLIGVTDNDVLDSYWVTNLGGPVTCVDLPVGAVDCASEVNPTVFFDVSDTHPIYATWDFTNVWSTVYDDCDYPPLQFQDVCGVDSDGDGYGTITGGCCPEQDCDDSLPFVNPGATEVCSDGYDNDCDGDIDCDDSDCEGDGDCEEEPDPDPEPEPEPGGGETTIVIPGCIGDDCEEVCEDDDCDEEENRTGDDTPPEGGTETEYQYIEEPNETQEDESVKGKYRAPAAQPEEVKESLFDYLVNPIMLILLVLVILAIILFNRRPKNEKTVEEV